MVFLGQCGVQELWPHNTAGVGQVFIVLLPGEGREGAPRAWTEMVERDRQRPQEDSASV